MPGRDGQNSDEASAGAGSYEVTSLVPDRPQPPSPRNRPTTSTSPRQGTRKTRGRFRAKSDVDGPLPRTSSLFRVGVMLDSCCRFVLVSSCSIGRRRRLGTVLFSCCLWVPMIRSWALTRDYALHPGTRNRYEIRDTRTQHRPPSRQVNDHGRVSGTHTHHHLEPAPARTPRQRLHRPLQRPPAPPLARSTTPSVDQTAKRQRTTAASNHPSDTLRRTHQRMPKSRLTSRDRVSGTHTLAAGGAGPPRPHRAGPDPRRRGLVDRCAGAAL